MAKLSLSRAWSESTAVLARDGRLIIAVALALFVLPGLVLDVSMPEAAAGQFPPAGPWMAIAALVLVASLIGQLSVIRLAMGPHISVGEAMRHGTRRLPSYIAAVLMWTMPILIVGSLLYAFVAGDPQHPSVPASLGLILLCVLGTFVAVRLVLSSAVASAEGVGPLGILERSWVMSHGNWWRLFAFLLLFAVGAIAMITAVGAVSGLIAQTLLGGMGRLTMGGLLVAVVSQLVSAVISVIFFVMIARIYVQLSSGPAEASVPTTGI
jgi:hypothetical protein